MIEREDVVAAIVAAAGGEFVGRVRLQKTVYFLQNLGLGTGMSFEYHHYGPYSRELDSATIDAKAFNLVDEQFDRRQSDGAMFSIFRISDDVSVHESAYAPIGRERVSEITQRFAATNVTVLELAATIDWLWRIEKYSDWRTEIAKRKGKKVEGGRLDKAIDLLQTIGLKPPSSQPSPALF